jgi:hypothetical protein
MSAFYTSNVEQYLMRGAAFDQFARNVAKFPRTSSSVIIRSYFLGNHPQAVPGYHATQIAQFVDRFVALEAAGAFGSYYDVATRDVIRN